MKEYMTSLGTVLMLIALSDMLIPEGSIKKYASLAMGFMLISTALSAFPATYDFSFDEESFSIEKTDTSAYEAQYRAEVMQRHRENLESKIEKELSSDGKAYVEVSPDGRVISVTLTVKKDESRAISYIISNLDVPRERITIKYDEN